MEKVRVTQEQAEAIEDLKEQHLETLKSVFKRPEYYDLNKGEEIVLTLTPEEYHSALYDGYDVKPIAKAGDYAEVVWGRGTITRKVLEIAGDRVVVSLDGSMLTGATPIRILSDEEAQEHKRKEWWKSHNRGDGELRTDDILRDCQGKLYCVVTVDSVGLYVLDDKSRLGGGWRKQFTLVCFGEDRKDIKI